MDGSWKIFGENIEKYVLFSCSNNTIYMYMEYMNHNKNGIKLCYLFYYILFNRIYMHVYKRDIYHCTESNAQSSVHSGSYRCLWYGFTVFVLICIVCGCIDCCDIYVCTVSLYCDCVNGVLLFNWVVVPRVNVCVLRRNAVLIAITAHNPNPPVAI